MVLPMYYALTELIEGLARSAYNGLLAGRAIRKPASTEQKPKGVVIGTQIGGEDPAPFAICDADRSRHLYILGSTGAGKTNLLLKLIASDIERKRTVIVIDLRGDLIDRALRIVAADSAGADRLSLIDLRQEDFVAGFNPLTGSGDLHSRALYVLDVLRSHAESWGVALDETLRNALLALAEAGHSLCEIEPLLTNGRYRERIAAQLCEPNASAYFARYGELSPDRQSTLSMPVLNKVTPFLAVPRVRRMLGSGAGLEIGRLMDEPGRILLVSLAVDRLHSAAHLVGSLLVRAIQHSAMARVDLPETRRNPVSLYIDEFETMASDSFAAIIAEGRRFGLSLTLSHQNLFQLSNTLRQSLRNNAGLQIFFQTGALDASELSGEIIGLGSKDEVKSLLQSQRVGQAIFVRRGQVPVQVQVDRYEDPAASDDEVHALKAKAHQSTGRPCAEVDAEIAARLREPAAAHTIRHERKPAAKGRKRS